MAVYLLNRNDAPFGGQVWDLIDRTVVDAAKSQLFMRRVVDIEGPFGLGTKSVQKLDRPTDEKSEFYGATAVVMGSDSIRLANIQSTFFISSRDIAAFESSGIAFDASQVANAAIATARQEDIIVLSGSKALDIQGLMNHPGTNAFQLNSWDAVGAAANDIMSAVTQMDKAGFHGPYSLALAPNLYNALFRKYPDTNILEIQHIREFVTAGVEKAAAIRSGGVLINYGTEYVSIVLGQDIMAGFIGPTAGGYDFSVSESVTVRVKEPQAVTVLGTK